MNASPLLFTLVVLFAFSAGITCTLSVLLLVEKRALAKPGARVEAARRMLDGGVR